MASLYPPGGGPELSPSFRFVMGTAQVPVLVKNRDGYYIYANRAAEVLLGYEPEQIRGKHILDLVNNDAGWLEAEFARFKADGVWNGTLIFRRREGELVPAALNAFMSSIRNQDAFTAMLHPLQADGPITKGREQLYNLTAPDLRLLQLLAEGFTDNDLASILDVSSWAVARDIALVQQKMQVSSRTEACIRAIQAHLIY